MAVASFLKLNDGENLLLNDGTHFLLNDSGAITDGPYQTTPGNIFVPGSEQASIHVPGATAATISQ